MEDDDEEMTDGKESSMASDDDAATASASAERTEDEDMAEELAKEDVTELEAVRKERMDLMKAEREALEKEATAQAGSSDGGFDKIDYLVKQSDVFAHFLAGSVAITDKKKGRGKKGGGGSRGKKGRMTEAQEDAQLMATAQSHRRTIRLDKQPSILSSHCKMYPYQLEGLNWLIKLHDHGLNGILGKFLFYLNPSAQINELLLLTTYCLSYYTRVSPRQVLFLEY